jgi:hypothetical protein
MRLFLFVLLATPASFASASQNDLQHLPKPFAFRESQAVFADFEEAQYEITYDLSARQAMVRAEIRLQTLQPGYPVFDSVTEPTSIQWDGVPVRASLTRTPSQETSVRVVEQLTAPGPHRLQVTVPLTELVEFRPEGVRSAFWTSDLSERRFLERYLPANLEFDQVKMSFLLRFKGANTEQALYTNGMVTRYDGETFLIQFPSHFTASSIFFHTAPRGSFPELRFTLPSIDGRALPVVLYTNGGIFSSSLERLKDRVVSVMAELERDYGPFPHPSVTVYLAGSGGMEYCGATMTDFSAVGHELFHSYFARGMMPANGNAGWIDEALASWRDDGYQSIGTLSGSTGMSSHPYYTRTTDRAAYSFGERFMSYLDGKTRSKGGLKPFMRELIATRVFRPFFIEEFIGWMGQYYQSSFQEDFKRYTFGGAVQIESAPAGARSREIHRKLNPETLRSLL